MVRRRASAVSNHEATSRASSFETRYALLRTRVVGFTRATSACGYT
jgi:hypothetical protein